MTDTKEQLEVQTFDYSKEVTIAASAEITWDAVLAEIGPEGQMPDGKSYPFKFEPWPGGRWFRDLGKYTGHLWGFVQVIKPPKLLEISGRASSRTRRRSTFSTASRLRVRARG
jgi:uncharacterized protein YndB with AHSA1/START domain